METNTIAAVARQRTPAFRGSSVAGYNCASTVMEFVRAQSGTAKDALGVSAWRPPA